MDGFNAVEVMLLPGQRKDRHQKKRLKQDTDFMSGILLLKECPSRNIYTVFSFIFLNGL